jgi:penicillin-binding protein 2
MIGAIANGGLFYKPYLLKQTRNRETGVVKKTRPDRKGRIILDSAALEEVRKALFGVVNEPGGTAHGAATPLATVAGKTGTAQVIAQKIPGQKLTGKQEDHAWFIAYAPAEKPQIAVAVLVEHGGHGGAAAAPIAKKVIEEYLKNDGPPLGH